MDSKCVLYLIATSNTQYAIRNTQYAIHLTALCASYAIRNTQYAIHLTVGCVIRNTQYAIRNPPHGRVRNTQYAVHNTQSTSQPSTLIRSFSGLLIIRNGLLIRSSLIRCVFRTYHECHPPEVSPLTGVLPLAQTDQLDTTSQFGPVPVPQRL